MIQFNVTLNYNKDNIYFNTFLIIKNIIIELEVLAAFASVPLNWTSNEF